MHNINILFRLNKLERSRLPRSDGPKLADKEVLLGRNLSLDVRHTNSKVWDKVDEQNYRQRMFLQQRRSK